MLKPEAFDRWTTTLATGGTSRRRAVQIGIGASVAALFGHAVSDEAAACRKSRKSCGLDRQCCSGLCQAKQNGKPGTCATTPRDAYGCTVNRDSCRNLPNECPDYQAGSGQPPYCFRRNNDKVVCAFINSQVFCTECEQDSDCLPVNDVPGVCISRCQFCKKQNPNLERFSSCIYPVPPA